MRQQVPQGAGDQPCPCSSATSGQVRGLVAVASGSAGSHASHAVPHGPSAARPALSPAGAAENIRGLGLDT